MTSARTGDTVFRRWCALGTALAAAFIVYGSLMPFHFEGPFHGSHVLEVLKSSVSDLSLGTFSRSDFLANILLYVPIGFCGGGLLVRHGDGVARWVQTALALMIGAAGLSLFVEALQVFVPTRTASLGDVAAALVGTIAGFGGWRLLADDVRTWVDRWGVGDRAGIARGSLAVYTIALVILILWPLDITLDLGGLAAKVRAGGVVLNPLHSPVLHVSNLPGLLLDFLLAVPVGIWASVAGAGGKRRSIAIGAALAIVLFGAVESAQVLILSCRADALEFLVNAAGAVAGVCLTAAIVPAEDQLRPVAAVGAPGRLATVGLVAALLFYAVYNLSPFNFQLSPDLIRHRVGDLVGIPFYGYYINPQLKALGDALTKISLGLPIGVFLQMWVSAQSRSYNTVIALASLFLTGLFLTAIEAGQVILPTRYPDDTDIILAFIGVIVGMWAVRALWVSPAAGPPPIPMRRRSSRRSRSRVRIPTIPER